MYFSAADAASAAIRLSKSTRIPEPTTVFMQISLGFDSRDCESVNLSHVPCDFHTRLVDPDDFS
jgi:hypothetical protein